MSSHPVDPVLYQSMKFRSIGPTRGGRVVAVSGVVGDRNTYYFGSTGGGVWKSDDAGAHWRNISDGYFNYASVGAIAVAPSDPNVIYVGMGETTIRNTVSRGDGVYKSTDAGKTWQHMGLAETRNIGKVIIHPQNPDLVYVAAFGHVFGSNPDRGLYRSHDGGKTWERILYVSDKAGVNDLSIDPSNPRILYAVSWEAFRTPYSLSSGGEGSKLFRSVDAGDTWQEISRNTGLPKEGLFGKIGVAASGPQPGRLWTIVEHEEEGAVYRSDDYGDTWVKLSDDRNLRQRAWYYHHIYADPQDPHTVWVLNVELWKSIDAGKTFQQISAPHGDNHDLWINPDDPDNMILGNDGGALVTVNGGAGWSSIYNQPTGEFYHVTTDNQFPYRIYGAQQDNTTMSIASRSRNIAIIFPDWKEIGGGESGYIAVDPEDPAIVYAGSYGGNLTRFDQHTEHQKDITVYPRMMMGHGAKDLKYRWQWTSPIAISPHNHQVVYSAGNILWRTTDGGQSWEQMSPDLTRADPETLQPSGGPITRDNTGAETYATIFAFAESPVEPGVLWAGSDDGLVHISRDNGGEWVNVNPPQMPDWALITIIEPSPHIAGKAYIAATRYRGGDERPYLYKTEDYGQTWTEIIDGIPWDEATGSGAFTRTIREDPEREGLLFAGTETGLYVSFNDGQQWQPLQLNLPITPVHDLIIQSNDLVVGTHGRSFWILDDISPLRQASQDLTDQPLHLFQPSPTVRYPASGDFGPHPPRPGRNYHFAGGFIPTYEFTKNEEDGTTEITFTDAGNNPPSGVVFHYYLGDQPKDTITLTILDAEGNQIRTFDSDHHDKKQDPSLRTSAGANRFIWNMRYPSTTQLDEDSAGSPGPRALPGRYQATLTVRDHQATQQFEIVPDPRRAESTDDYRAQFELLQKINARITETTEAIKKIRSIREQAKAWAERSDNQQIKDAAKDIDEKFLAIEGELIQYRAKSLQDTLNFEVKLDIQLAALGSYVENAEGQPPAQAYQVFDEISEEIDTQLQALQQAIDQDLAAFNALIANSATTGVQV